MASPGAAATEHGYVAGRIQEIRELHRTAPSSLEDVKANVAKETEILVDILPAYRVRDEKENDDGKKSKHVRSLQKIEGLTLQMYTKFLNQLVEFTRKKDEPTKAIAYTALCKLLPSGAYFNHSQQLITAIVQGGGCGYIRISVMCGQALREMYNTDGQGLATLTAVQETVKYVRAHTHGVQKPLLEALLFIHTDLLDIDKAARVNKLRTTVKAQGTDEETKNYQKMQTNLFERLLAAYLRVLEVAATTKGKVQNRLLEPVLQGLGKISHLVNTDILQTLLKALQDILKAPDTSALVGLNTVMTAVMMIKASLKRSGGANISNEAKEHVSTDQKVYYNHLYALIPSAMAPPTLETITSSNSEHTNPASEHSRTVLTLLRVVRYLLLSPGTKVPKTRVMAFARRLSLYATHLPSFLALRVLTLIQSLGQKYPEVSELAFTAGNEAVGVAVPNLNVNDPDLANPQSSILWELTLFNKSMSPCMRQLRSPKFMKPEHERLIGLGDEIPDAWSFDCLEPARKKTRFE